MTQAVVLYNALVLLLVIVALVLLSRSRPQRLVPTLVLLGTFLAIFTFGGGVLGCGNHFGKIQLLAWAVFVHCPLFLIGVDCLCFHRKRILFYPCAVLAIAVALIGIDAFLLEPRWIEVSRITIPSSKLQSPIRVAVLADLQTDRPNGYEQHVFELAAAEQPDLILFAGDYLQISDPAEYLAAKTQLNALMLRSHIQAPLGMYAVRGNVDRQDWPDLFTGLAVTTLETTATQDLGPILLTGLTLEDSADTTLSVSAQEKFHIVLGHKPDYCLGQVNADLLLAGHTHGGQVQIPFFGPVLTLTRIPRAWASGVSRIAPGKHLIVSRGVGMERGRAPRLRFLCRPELLIIDLLPHLDPLFPTNTSPNEPAPETISCVP